MPVQIAAQPAGGAVPAAPPNLAHPDTAPDIRIYPFIPAVLYNDAIFSRFICPITGAPIRDPVGDPVAETTLYERRAILNWLRVNQTSPLTRNPLVPNQLVEKPAVKAVIDARLAHHQQELQNYLQAHLADPVPAAAQEIIEQYA
jgi:hypothetical protein